VPKFPEPPGADALRRVAPVWRELPAGTLLARVYNQGGPHPTSWNTFRFYGPLDGRFDHHVPPPSAQARGILYAATLAVTCLAERFQAARTIDPFTAEPWLVVFRLRRSARLLGLTRNWLTQAGASMAINSGQRPRARRSRARTGGAREPWSRTIYEAYPEAEGLWYASSMYANAPAVALYERAKQALPLVPEANRALADAVLQISLENAALDLNYALIARPLT
jgi:hypothetical protein